MEPNGDGGWRLPTEKEVEVAEILLNLPKLWQKSELVTPWGRKKKRSVLPESPSPAAKPDHKNPSTPLCFLPSDGELIKAPDGDDMMKIYNRMQQEKEILMKKMETQHQQLVKAKGKVQNYDEQRFHQQITIFAPPTPPPPHCLPQLVMNNNVLRVKNATAARKRRMPKLKENKINSLLPMKLSTTCR